MDLFQPQKESLKLFLREATPVRTAIVWGSFGVGKSRAIQEVLNDTSAVWITFSKENFTAFEALRKATGLSADATYEDIIYELSLIYFSKDCVVYENLECCERDSMELIKQVIQFSRNNSYPAVSIMEWNGDEVPTYIDSIYTDIPFRELTDSEVAQYIHTIVQAGTSEELAYITNQLTQACTGNLQNLQLSINILVQRGILNKTSSGVYVYKGKKFQGSLFLMYLDLFQELNDRIQRTLKMVSPFEEDIYASLLKEAFSNCQALDAYLDELSEHHSFILCKQSSDEKGIIAPRYSFASTKARDAVIEAMAEVTDPELSLQKITARLYQHLEVLRKNPVFYSYLDIENRIRLLRLLTKVRNCRLTVNHLPYYVELMEYYFQQSSYWAVIKSAELFLGAHALSTAQIHQVQPQFFRLLFKAQLATGQYQAVIRYEGKFQDWDIRLLIARAHYNNGAPQKALELCRDIKSMHDEAPHGEVFSLEASIYDWLGNSKQSLASFKKALLYIGENEELKYTLFKKYNLYLDFDLPECKRRMLEAAQYFSCISKRQHAEVLHNYGTSLVLSFPSGGITDLELSERLLQAICDKEIYYPRNSIAIYYALRHEFQKAIAIWKGIDYDNIQIDFCRLVIQNNLLCAYIKTGDLDAAERLREELKQQISNLGSASLRPDLQHPIRQYYLNCGLLSLANNQEYDALKHFEQALECSRYPSTMLYLIENEINRLQTKFRLPLIKRLRKILEVKKLGQPNSLDKYFAEHRMYFCIIMFWGDC